MIRQFVSPGHYVQGAGALSSIGSYVKRLAGQNASVSILGGKSALSITGVTITKSLSESGIHVAETVGDVKICSHQTIEALSKIVKGEVTIGVGGGSVLDTAKAVANETRTGLVCVPTIASTDAPCSALSVLYTEDGKFDRYLFFPRNPDIVIADSGIIAESPADYLVWGMGDALATRFEAEACMRSDARNTTGDRPTFAALTLAQLCYRNLLEFGVAAKAACQSKSLTPALDRIIETNIFLSGIGFESGGLAAAHSIQKGATFVEGFNAQHGMIVAFGTLVQLVLEKQPQDVVHQVYDFCRKIGLPTTLADIGLRRDDVSIIARESCKEGYTIHNEPFEITTDGVKDAILTADNIGIERA